MSNTSFSTTVEKMEIAVQPDGKILIAGPVCLDKNNNSSGEATEIDFGIMKLNPDGALDSSFGSSGKQTI